MPTRGAAVFPSRSRGEFELSTAARAALDAGRQRVIVGTAIWSEEEALAAFVEALGDQLVVALDVRDGQIAVRGWRDEANSPSATLWRAVGKQASLGFTSPPSNATARCADRISLSMKRRVAATYSSLPPEACETTPMSRHSSAWDVRQPSWGWATSLD